MRSRNKFILPALLLLMLALRLGILLTSVERVSHYDEIDLGTIARDLMRGLYVPFSYYQLDAYSGESFILGPLVIPFAKIFGLNLFAIKMVPLFFSLFALIVIYLFVRRYFGEKAAFYASLLFICAPPGLVQLSLVNMAGHSEAFFFGFLAVVPVYEYLFGSRKLYWLAASGLLGGFAVWFYYANAMMIVSGLLVFWIVEPRLFLRALPVWVLFFLAGFSPWIISNARNHFTGLDVFSGNVPKLDAVHLLYFIKKPARFFLINLPSSLATLNIFFIPKKIFSFFYYFTGVVVVAPLLFGKIKEKRMLLFLIYPVVYLGVVLLTQFDLDRDIGFIGYRYATPLLIMLLLAAGICCAALDRKVLFATLVLSGLLGQFSLMGQEPPGRALRYEGYSYYQLGTRWHFNLAHAFRDFQDFQQQIARFPERERFMIFWGMVQMSISNGQEGLFEDWPGKTKNIPIDRILPEAPAFRPVSYEWLGALPRFFPDGNLPAFEAAAKSVPEDSRRYFCQGWLGSPRQAANFLDCPDCYPGKNICDILMLDRAIINLEGPDLAAQEERLRKIASFKPEEKKRAYRGLGYALFFFDAVLDPLDKIKPAIDTGRVAEEDMPEVYWGIGWGIRERFREDRTRAMDWIGRLPEKGRAQAIAGLEAFERWYAIG